MRTFLAVAALVLVGAGVAFVQASNKNADAQDIGPTCETSPYWTRPTTGTEVVYYEAEVALAADTTKFTAGDITIFMDKDVNGNSITGEILTHKGSATKFNRIRVRGVDANEKQGPWSDWSFWKDLDCLDDPVIED